jgi:membrane associated rhomboid family serine protease
MLICTYLHFLGHGWAATFTDIFQQPLTLIGYIITHPTFGHLFGNMMFLLLFGPACERALGKAHYILLFILCGILSGIGFLAVYEGALLVGASGAISGLIAIYPLVQRSWLSRVVGAISCSAYFWIQLTSFILDIQTGQVGVAHLGHLLGGAVGLILFSVFKKK